MKKLLKCWIKNNNYKIGKIIKKQDIILDWYSKNKKNIKKIWKKNIIR